MLAKIAFRRTTLTGRTRFVEWLEKQGSLGRRIAGRRVHPQPAAEKRPYRGRQKYTHEKEYRDLRAYDFARTLWGEIVSHYCTSDSLQPRQVLTQREDHSRLPSGLSTAFDVSPSCESRAFTVTVWWSLLGTPRQRHGQAMLGS